MVTMTASVTLYECAFTLSTALYLFIFLDKMTKMVQNIYHILQLMHFKLFNALGMYYMLSY